LFVRNSWYVAGRPEDIGRQPVHRMICENAIVLFRKEDGTAIAMQDHCPHRRFALSKGRVEGDQIRCMYHGLLFDESGTCTHVPGQAEIPADLQARVYPVIEEYGWVWVWLGDNEVVGDLSIPDFAYNCTPGWAASFGDTKISADYRLILDNFHDFTHVGYVHEATIGTTEVSEAAVDIEYDKQSIQFSRQMIDVPVPPTFQKVGNFSGNIDRFQKAKYSPPVNICNAVRIHPTGEHNESNGLRLMFINSLAPESRNSTHYYWSVARNFALEDDKLGDRIYQEVNRAFDEDLEVIEIQQKMLNLDESAVPLRNLKSDQANVLMRNILKRLIAEEQS